MMAMYTMRCVKHTQLREQLRLNTIPITMQHNFIHYYNLYMWSNHTRRITLIWVCNRKTSDSQFTFFYLIRTFCVSKHIVTVFENASCQWYTTFNSLWWHQQMLCSTWDANTSNAVRGAMHTDGYERLRLDRSSITSSNSTVRRK
jgi:hypothetical protein